VTLDEAAAALRAAEWLRDAAELSAQSAEEVSRDAWERLRLARDAARKAGDALLVLARVKPTEGTPE